MIEATQPRVFVDGTWFPSGAGNPPVAIGGFESEGEPMTQRLSAQRVTLISLVVDDLERAGAFYKALGWEAAQELPEVTFYRLKGLMLGLIGRDALGRDQGRPGAELGTGGMTLAQNYGSKAEVDTAFATAVSAGATVLKQPERVYWGGYSGYYPDPDGHVWEIAHNPFWPLDSEGYLAEDDGQ